MGFWSKIKHKANLIISLPATIYFNLKYFPIHQGIKLPVFLCYPRISGNGKYIIEGKVKTGMIRMGFPLVSIYRRKGIVLENKGKITFTGNCMIGADGGISIGETGDLRFGDKVSNTFGLKIVCYNKIILGNKVRLGWDTLICDTDFHKLKSKDGSKYSKGYGEIKIDDEVWVGSFCKIYKNSYIPMRCTIAANTLINKKIDCPPYSLIYSGEGIKVKNTGFYRDIEDDYIDYNSDSI